MDPSTVLRGGSASPSLLARSPGESVNPPVDPSEPSPPTSPRRHGSAAMADFDDFGDGDGWMPDSPTLPLVEYCVPGPGQQEGGGSTYNSSVLLRLLDVAAEYGGEKEVREAAAYMQANVEDAAKCAELLYAQAMDRVRDRASSQRSTVQVLHLLYVANELLTGPRGVWTGLLTEHLDELLPLACKTALRRDEKDVYRRIVDLPASVWVYPVLPSATREKLLTLCGPNACQPAPESPTWMGNTSGNNFARAVSPSCGSPPPSLRESPPPLGSPPPFPSHPHPHPHPQHQQQMGCRAQPVPHDHADAALNDLVEQSLQSGNDRSMRQGYEYPMRATRAPQAAYVPVSTNDSYADGFFGGGSYGHLLGSRHLGGGLGHAEGGDGASERVNDVHADGSYGYFPGGSYANGWGGDATLTGAGPQRCVEGVGITTTWQIRQGLDPRLQPRVPRLRDPRMQQQQHEYPHQQRDCRAMHTHQHQALRDQFGHDTSSAWGDSVAYEAAPYGLIPGRMGRGEHGGQAWGPVGFVPSRPEFDRPQQQQSVGGRHAGGREVSPYLRAGRECARRGHAEMESDVIDLDKWRPAAPADEITDASPNYTRVYPAVTGPWSSSGCTHAYSMPGTAMLPNKRRALNERGGSNGAQRGESVRPPWENVWGRDERPGGGEGGGRRRETAYSAYPHFEQRSRCTSGNSNSFAPPGGSLGHRMIPSGMFQSRGMFSTWKGHEGRAYDSAMPPREDVGERGGRSGGGERGRKRNNRATSHSPEVEAAEGGGGGNGNRNRERCVDNGLVEWLESMSADQQPSATPIPERVDLTDAPGGANDGVETGSDVPSRSSSSARFREIVIDPRSSKNGEEWCLEVKKDAEPEGDEVTVEWQEISLKCPLSQKRIEAGMACKGSNCKHVQCFDGMAWNSFQERARLSQAKNNANKCPHCGQIIERLVGSAVFDRILKDAPPGVDSVRIDSKWNVQPSEASSFEVAHVRDEPVDGGAVNRDAGREASDSSVIVID